MSKLRAQNFMALDAPCEEKLSTMVTEYNKLADRWTDLRSQLAEREAELERLRDAGDALARSVEQPPSTRPDDLAQTLATWHTATGGTR